MPMQDLPPTPLYRQIADLVTRDIAAGRLLEGERLPPERAMAATHGIAVGTLRKALQELVDQGLIERRQGSGNYVRGVRSVGGLYGFFRLETPSGPGLPGAQLISVDRLAKPSDAPDFGAAPDAHRIRRLRLLDDAPAAVEEIWLDAGRAPGFGADRIGPSLYRSYLTEFGLRILRVEDRVGIGRLPGWGAALGLAGGASVGHVHRLSWAQDGTPVEYSRTWFDPDKVSYVNRLK
ncbi:GntR family transcriptional regulator [Palleronia pelagia]|nr:GntR family transcriptional regulator [Palleronia pelagia]